MTPIDALTTSLDLAANRLISDLARMTATALADLYTPRDADDPTSLPYFSDSILDDLTALDDAIRICNDAYFAELLDDPASPAIAIHSILTCTANPSFPYPDCIHMTLIDLPDSIRSLMTYSPDSYSDDPRPACPNDPSL
jgi:hypothetical protein